MIFSFFIKEIFGSNNVLNISAPPSITSVIIVSTLFFYVSAIVKILQLRSIVKIRSQKPTSS